MRFERITTSNHPLYEEAINLYKISFPTYEQREEASQTKILQNSDYHFVALCDEDEFIGEILYWKIGNFLYVEHFCILPTMRNRQYGQKVLETLQDTPLILEIDPPVDSISQRRKGFYERCGFVENPYSHVHPPYHRGNSGHELVFMSSPEMLTFDEYRTFNDYLQDVIMGNAY